MRKLASGFAAIAKPAGVELQTCAELIDLDEFGIGHASYIDIGEYDTRLSFLPVV